MSFVPALLGEFARWIPIRLIFSPSGFLFLYEYRQQTPESMGLGDGCSRSSWSRDSGAASLDLSLEHWESLGASGRTLLLEGIMKVERICNLHLMVLA